jgi:hypothetical protein
MPNVETVAEPDFGVSWSGTTLPWGHENRLAPRICTSFSVWRMLAPNGHGWRDHFNTCSAGIGSRGPASDEACLKAPAEESARCRAKAFGLEATAARCVRRCDSGLRRRGTSIGNAATTAA